MASCADATAAPSRVKIGKHSFLVSPLRDREWGEMQRWVQDRHVDNRLRLLERAGVEGEKLDAERMKVAEEAARITLASVEFQQALTCVEGVMYYVWLSLWREHDVRGRDETMILLADADLLQVLADAANRLETSPVKKKRSKARMKKPKRSKRK